MVLIAQVPLFAAAATVEENVVALRAPQPEARRAAHKALVKAGPAAVRELLASIRNRRSSEQAHRILLEMGDEAIPALLALLDDPELQVRAGGALFQAVKSGDHRFAPRFLACLRNPAVNHYCGTSLVKAMSPQGASQMKLLLEGLKDSDPVVRTYAAAALGQIGPKAGSAVPALCEALKDSQPGVRAAAIAALDKLGKAAKPAIPALQAVSNDSNEEIRRQAAELLMRLNG